MSKPNNERLLTAERMRGVITYDSLTGQFTPAGTRRRRGGFGWPTGNGYLCTEIDGERIYLHRLAWFWVYDVWPIGELDHINGIVTDNRIENLREATVQQNRANRLIARRVRRSGTLKGAYRDKKTWAARITVGRKVIHIGNFLTEAGAHAAYVEAAQRYFGEFANPGAGSPHHLSRPDTGESVPQDA